MDMKRSELPGGLSNQSPFRGNKESRIKEYFRSFKKQQIKRYFPIFFLPTVTAFVIVFLWPFLRGLYLSFCEFRNINSARFVGIENYINAFSDKGFLRSFIYTLAFTVISVIFINVIAFAVAYVLTRRIRGRDLFRTVFFMPNLIGGIVLGYIWQLIINGVLSWYVGEDITYNTAYGFWGLVILICWQQIGYMMIIYIAALGSVPDEVVEAARLDGAGGFSVLKKVIIPYTQSAITICTFLTLTNSFKLYDQNEALTAGRPIEILSDGTQVKTTSMIAKNIVDNFSETYLSSNGTAQAKAVIFFVVVVAISLLQLYFTRKKEIEE
jgi:raffinose/stachyose/melibiose transport system permease protein